MADKDTGLGAEIKDLIETLKAYAKQETLGPLKGLGRYLAFGIAGSIMMALAAVLLVLGGLRALQSQLTWFDSTWSFAPYLFAAVALLLIIAMAGLAVSREKKTS